MVKATAAQIKKLQQIADGKVRIVRETVDGTLLERDGSGTHRLRVKIGAYLEAIPYREIRAWEDKKYYNDLRREYMRLNDAGRTALTASTPTDAR